MLHSFDSRAFEDDVKQALAERYQQNPIEIVRWYHDHNDRIHATEFAGADLSRWTTTELLQIIMGEFAMRPDGLVNEIELRGALLDGAKVCLKNSSWDLALAEELSNKALISVDATMANKEELLATWRPVLGDRRVKAEMRKQKESRAKVSKIFLLLNLFDDPETTGRDFGKACMTYLGKGLVKEALDAKGPYGAMDKYNILRQFDTKAFESEKPKEQPKPPPKKQPKTPPKQEPKTKPKKDDTTEKQMGKPRFQTEQRVRVGGLESAAGKRLNGVSVCQ